MINKVPDSFLRYGHHGDKCHLVKRIKDGTEALIVYKFWRPEKQRWQYIAEKESLILIALNQSQLISKGIKQARRTKPEPPDK